MNKSETRQGVRELILLDNCVRESILLAIESIKDEITRCEDPEANKTRAEAIRILTEAYKNVGGPLHEDQ